MRARALPWGDESLRLAEQRHTSFGDFAYRDGEGRLVIVPAGGVAALFLAWRAVAWRFSPAVAAADAWAAVASPEDGHPRARERAAVEAVIRAFDLDPTDDAAADSLARAMVKRLPELRKAVGMDGDPPTTDAGAMAWEDVPGVGRMLAWDARLARYLEGIGPTGKKSAARLRRNATARGGAHATPEPGRLWSGWCERDDSGNPLRWPVLELFAGALWGDAVGPALSADRAARRESKPFEVAALEGPDGDRYAKVEKAFPALSWAFGGDWAPASEVDGDRYLPTTARLLRAVPASWALLGGVVGEKSPPLPHQLSLPMDLPSDDATEPLIVAVTGRRMVAVPDDGKQNGGQEFMPAVAGKGGVFLLVTTEAPGWHGGAVEDIAAELFPGEELRHRHLVAVAETMRWWKSVAAVLKNGECWELFIVSGGPAVPEAVQRGQRYAWRRGPLFAGEVPWTSAQGPMRRGMGGQFLVNYSATMRMDMRNPARFRYYIRGQAGWNDARNVKTGKLEVDGLRRYDVEEWAILNNALSPAARAYLQGVGGAKQARWNDLKRAWKTLEEMHAAGLICLVGPGGGVAPSPKGFRIASPGAFEEAYRTWRDRWKK